MAVTPWSQSERADLRQLLHRLLKNDSLLTSFCVDYFTEVARGFSQGMSTTDKVNLLFLHVEPEEIRACLREKFPTEIGLFGPRATHAEALSAALELDRKAQWGDILDACGDSQNALFLLHGQSERAGLRFFLDRISKRLSVRRNDHHRVLRVRLTVDRQLPQSGAEWEVRLRDALLDVLGRSLPRPNVAQMLKAVTTQQPLFLVLGNHPLSVLGESEQLGLMEFISERISACLAEAHNVRILLAHDYDRPSDSLVAKIAEWARKAAERGSFRFYALEEAVLPSRKHIEEFLRDVNQVPKARAEEILRDFDALKKAHRNLSYDKLSDYLDRTLDI